MGRVQTPARWPACARARHSGRTAFAHRLVELGDCTDVDALQLGCAGKLVATIIVTTVAVTTVAVATTVVTAAASTRRIGVICIAVTALTVITSVAICRTIVGTIPITTI